MSLVSMLGQFSVEDLADELTRRPGVQWEEFDERTVSSIDVMGPAMVIVVTDTAVKLDRWERFRNKTGKPD